MNSNTELISYLEKTKFDLNDIYSKFNFYIEAFKYKPKLKRTITPTLEIYREIISSDNYKYIDEYGDELESFVWYYVQNNVTSIIAPAYNYNDLVNNEIKALKNFDAVNSYNDINLYYYGVSLHNCLYFIKTGLDRLVRIFHYYYNGIARESTFGHQKENGKYTGLLALAIQNQDSDKLLKYIIDQYNQWIKECVSFRDTITHYDDLFPFSCTNENGTNTGVGAIRKQIAFIDSKIIPGNPYVDTKSVKQFVENYYEMLSWIYEFLLTDDKRIGPCEFYGTKLSQKDVISYFDNPEEWIKNNTSFL